MALCLLVSVAAAAQQPVSPAAMASEVARLSAQAQTVFVGQIVGFARKGQTVEVSFRVEQPLRRAAPEGQEASLTGQVFVMREWAGLWAPRQQRYVLGQRVLAFLHGQSASGFASPVHGSEGLVPVLVQGADRPMLVDLGRVAASVQRTPQTPLPAAGAAVVPLSTVLQIVAAHTPAMGLQGVQGRLPAGLTPTNGRIRFLQHNPRTPLNPTTQGRRQTDAQR